MKISVSIIVAFVLGALVVASGWGGSLVLGFLIAGLVLGLLSIVAAVAWFDQHKRNRKLPESRDEPPRTGS